MITLHILQFLSDNNFGTLNEDLFLEKLPLKKKGIAIFSRGGEANYGRRSCRKSFDLYSRGINDIDGYAKLDEIKVFLSDSYDSICSLPTVPNLSKINYIKARFIVIGDIENIGEDENDNIIYRLSCEIIYEKGE